MYTLIFSVGLPYSAKQQEELRNESLLHGDVLQANYFDSYRNLTYKQLAELRYIASSCYNVKALLKLDDDVGWNVTKTAHFINANLTTNEIYCARRITEEEWSLPKYPTHCAGLMYIASPATIRRMLDVVHLQRFFWIDDVFITGVLTDASNVTVKRFGGVNEKRKKRRDRETFFYLNKEDIMYWFLNYNQNVL
ncbi:N-acetyllactosaminide 3-alpha-galactosyltransferase [Ancylostoma caninum]|uniref:Hexosyltransferase n=1 Tax=Ancylostoma caninum TaxID=29170 RepID=A0A368GJZ1_ANCCA|nr:N-acetyllactosaminide 3-alpha-galactosyltransferase [Ancylostoma caninum]